MRTAIIVLILGLTATSVMSACAANGNAVTKALKVVDADVLGTKVTLAAALTVCNHAIGAEICMTEATAGSKLQTAVDAYRTELQTNAGNRDKYIIAQRGEVVKVLDSLKKINGLATKADSISGTYATIAKAFVGYATTVASNFSSIVANFDTYQTSRQTCMNSLIKVQAGLLCNAIKDSPTAVAGLHDDTIAVINTACYPYVENSAKQSAIISTAVFSAGFAKLASGIEKAINNDASGATADITAAFAEMNKASYSGTAGQAAVAIPTGTNACDTATKDCKKWIENILHDTTTGLLKTDIAILGGDAVTKPTFVSSRVLKSEGNERRLVTTGYKPNLDDVKFTIDFTKNPGNVDNTQNAKDPNSALRNGIVACAVAALALVF